MSSRSAQVERWNASWQNDEFVLDPTRVILHIGLIRLDVKEIHGYRPELGLSVFTEETLRRNDAARQG